MLEFKLDNSKAKNILLPCGKNVGFCVLQQIGSSKCK